MNGEAHLLSIRVIAGLETITLADNGWMRTATNRVHLPMRVVIIDNVEKSPPAPWHPLNQSLPEPIESNCHLHY